MIFIHEFHTPRNLFEKLVRDYEQLDIVVSGDNIFNFVSTAHHMKEWFKRSPIQKTEVVKRFIKRVAHDRYIKLCDEMVCGKTPYSVIIDDPRLRAGTKFKYRRTGAERDLISYKNKTRKYTLRIGEKDFDPFKFKEEIMKLYSVYFKVKGQ